MKEVGMLRKILLFVLAQCLFAFPVFAQIQYPLKTHVFEVGAETYYMEYKEPGIMKNEGVMVGGFGSYTYHSGIMARVEARVAGGEVDYSSERTGSADDITDVAFETRGLLGFDLRAGYAVITPYAGFGYRYLNDDSQGTFTTTGHVGYERESNYYYSPIGLELTIPLQNRWSMVLTGEYDLFWSGKQESRLSGAIFGLSDVENDQDDGYGIRGSISFKKRLEALTLNFGAFYRYWRIDDSEVSPITFEGVLVGYGLEPENKTYEAGVMFSLYF
jgi:hypothetical protein